MSRQAHENEVLEENVTIKEIMDTWTLQIGFPVVTAVRNYEGDSLVLKQERYFLEAGKRDPSLWWIPISYTDRKSRLTKIWMKKEREVTVVDVKTSPGDWLLLNVNQTGFYRVNYDEENWRLLTDQLQRDYKHFDPKNRAQMIDDSLNLARSGHLSYEIALNLTTYLVKEKDYVPWRAAFVIFDYLQIMFQKSAHFDKLKVRDFTCPSLN